MRRGFLRGSRAGWWRCRSWPRSGRARPGWWSGTYGDRWIGVMRSSSRPGPWRPVRAFAWWGRALSGTTAILPASVSRWSRSSAPIVCQVSRFCSVGYGATVLLVGGRASEKDWDVLCRSTDRPGALPSFGGCMRRVRASCSKRPGQDGLGFLLPGAGGFRRVPVPRMPGRDPAHPGGPPVGRPLLHRPLRPLDRLSDDARIGATGGVQDRLGLHPGEHATAGPLPPPDQDGGLLPGRPRPARPHRIRNSTGDPRNTAPSHDGHR